MSKITALTEQGSGTLHDNDLFVNVDVSDTSMAATGTNKKSKWSSVKATLKTYFDTLYALFEVVPAVSQVTDVDFTGISAASLYGNYVDIPYDANGHLLRAWFDDDDAPGSAPATPTGGRIVRVGLHGYDTEDVMAAALASAVDADADVAASAATTITTVTQPAGELLDVTTTTGLALTVTTEGANSRNRLSAISGELLTRLSSTAVQFSATSRILGRATAGAGAAEELTASQVLDMRSTTVGEVLYRDTGDWQGIGGDGALKLRTGDTPVLQWSDSVGLVAGVTSTSTSMANVTGLAVTLPSAGTYMFNIEGMFSANTTTEGIGLSVNGPTASFLAFKVGYGATTTYINSLSRYTTYNDGPLASASGGTTSREFKISGVVTVSAGGSFTMRFRAETGGANSVTVDGGTNMHVIKL